MTIRTTESENKYKRYKNTSGMRRLNVEYYNNLLENSKNGIQWTKQIDQ